MINNKLTQINQEQLVEINVPVKPYIKRYLIKRYGMVHKISKRSLIGFMMLDLLDKNITTHDKDQTKTENYTFLIGDYYFKKYGFSMSEDNINYLSGCFDRLFNEDFLNFIDTELLKGSLNAYQSVSLFLSIYKIPEAELKHDSMYRKYQRYSEENIKKKKQNNNKIIAN
ncbi:hypothetical protein OOZ35_14220 [Mesoflavibacter profundi]|uniref:Uncharacterized protein n=1 Tax=Mesoflavibacter profundi TaxID=2708110 RepID=A0ABT4RVP4_9FLAO|nr:hypothetical protein [Mesoflavibacter profundi]MDA0175904.1 hypothetical protein [Mesoflavibacter profundi]MDA0178655.1 hypothetical protein [Mesoflavibacter profundi]